MSSSLEWTIMVHAHGGIAADVVDVSRFCSPKFNAQRVAIFVTEQGEGRVVKDVLTVKRLEGGGSAESRATRPGRPE